MLFLGSLQSRPRQRAWWIWPVSGQSCICFLRVLLAAYWYRLAERWWDTSHTFHIAGREMTMTPHDFHWMTDLWSDGLIINLENESSIQLGIDLLGCAYTTKHIHYFDLKRDYKPLSQATLDDHIRMARTFLLYLLGAYLFAIRGQIVSLSWLAFFCDFDHT